MAQETQEVGPRAYLLRARRLATGCLTIRGCLLGDRGRPLTFKGAGTSLEST